jgi:hypothetical protein
LIELLVLGPRYASVLTVHSIFPFVGEMLVT